MIVIIINYFKRFYLFSYNHHILVIYSQVNNSSGTTMITVWVVCNFESLLRSNDVQILLKST